MPTANATDILLATAKDLTAALRQHQQNPLLPPPDTQTRHALTKLNEIFSNATKQQEEIPATLPRVPTIQIKTPVTLPRVPATTTEGYLDITATNRRLRRQMKKPNAQKTKSKKTTKKNNKSQKPPAIKTKTKPSPIPESVPPPPPNPSSTRRSKRLYQPTTKLIDNLESNNFIKTTVRLPPKLQFLINKEIERAMDPSVDPLHKINAVLNADTGKLEEYRQLLKGIDKLLWEKGGSKEIARLAQGRKDGSVKGTKTLHFVPHNMLPKGKKPTYLRICANHRPQKADPYCIHMTVGGNLIEYNGETYTPTLDLTTAKLLFNSVISTPGATFFCLDLSNFHLITQFEDPSQYECIYIPEWAIPDDIMEEYDLRPLIKNGRLLAEIRTGMYSLPQAGRLSYIKLVKHLADDGYIPTGHTPGLFHHITRPTTFNLVVDDFGVKVVGQEHADHLIQTFQKHYDITIDRDSNFFCGIHLNWDL